LARLTNKKIRWFSLPNDPDNTRLQIQHLKNGELQRVEAETTKWIGRNVQDQFAAEMEFNPTSQARKVRAAALVDWEGFYDADGKKLPCNKANIALFLDEDPILGDGEKRMSEWIDDFRKELADEMKPQEEIADPN